MIMLLRCMALSGIKGSKRGKTAEKKKTECFENRADEQQSKGPHPRYEKGKKYCFRKAWTLEEKTRAQSSDNIKQVGKAYREGQ